MNKKGQALVEFILILPVILLIFISLIDVGNIFMEKYRLVDDLQTICDMYKTDKKEALAYASAGDIDLEEINNGNTTTIKTSKEVSISSPLLTSVLTKNYKIEEEKILYE